MKANKKKIIILVSMVVLLVATGVLNYLTNVRVLDADDVQTTGSVTLNFFESTKKNRELSRTEQIAILNEIIAVNASTESVIEAEAEKIAIVNSMQTELLLESLIIAKGFDDVIVAISPKLVNIVVNKADMTIEESAKIFDIVVSQTDYEAHEIQIVPYA
ncbi:MAG: SpoIIIAH-like family protein [Christensenellaceae bacterium]|jgi:stage III sporulation protein AH|nr:SpoIIIAH-like family protein [Christensenellaceae bacterium]